MSAPRMSSTPVEALTDADFERMLSTIRAVETEIAIAPQIVLRRDTARCLCALATAGLKLVRARKECAAEMDTALARMYRARFVMTICTGLNLGVLLFAMGGF